MRVNTGKRYTEYQVNKIINNLTNDFEKQWEDKVEEVKKSVTENIKQEMFVEFMSIATATLMQFYDFTEEQAMAFFDNYSATVDSLMDTTVSFTGEEISDENEIPTVEELGVLNNQSTEAILDVDIECINNDTEKDVVFTPYFNIDDKDDEIVVETIVMNND